MYALEHSLVFSEAGEWAPRGRAEVTVSSDPKLRGVKLLDQRNLTAGELSQFRELVDAGLFYRLRARRVDAPADAEWVMAPQRACTVLRANFREELKFHATKAGEVYALDYRAPFSPISAPCEDKPVPENAAFNSFASLSLPTVGAQIPHGATQDRPPMHVAQMLHAKGFKMQSGAGGSGAAGASAAAGAVPGAEGAKPPRQSFIRQYWYIILPLAVMSLAGGGEPAKKAKAT